MLTDEQTSKLKEQILKQLVNFPEDKREQIKEQILEMSSEEFEDFLIQNGLTNNGDNSSSNTFTSTTSKQQCVFCLINEGKIPSYKIDENKENTAILEINPLSKGHALIVPKKHLEVDKIPTSAFTLAKKITKKLESKFKPKEIQISSKNMFGHAIVEVLPLYGTEKGKKKASEKELIELQETLKAKPKKPRTKKEEHTKGTSERPRQNLPRLKPRIP